MSHQTGNTYIKEAMKYFFKKSLFEEDLPWSKSNKRAIGFCRAGVNSKLASIINCLKEFFIGKKVQHVIKKQVPF